MKNWNNYVITFAGSTNSSETLKTNGVGGQGRFETTTGRRQRRPEMGGYKTKAGAAINLRCGEEAILTFYHLNKTIEYKYNWEKSILHIIQFAVPFHIAAHHIQQHTSSRRFGTYSRREKRGEARRGEERNCCVQTSVTWSSWGISSSWIPLHRRVRSTEEAQSCLSTLMKRLHKPIARVVKMLELRTESSSTVYGSNRCWLTLSWANLKSSVFSGRISALPLKAGGALPSATAVSLSCYWPPW